MEAESLSPSAREVADELCEHVFFLAGQSADPVRAGGKAQHPGTGVVLGSGVDDGAGKPAQGVG